MIRAGSRSLAGTALVVAAGLLAACTSSPDDDPAPATPSTSDEAVAPTAIEDVLAAVQERVAVYDGIATGVVVLVRVGDEMTVVTGGKADVDRDVPMSGELRFPIASITKPMTAAATMSLVEDGRISLDDPVTTWLPELRAVRSTITVEHLLSHRSGLRDTSDADLRRSGPGMASLLRAAASHPLEFEPGSQGSYSNVGYGALGVLVSRELGQPFADVLAERVFEPAGMDSSTLFGPSDVHGYQDGEDVSADLLLGVHPGGGSVVSTVGDVDAFFQALWGDVLVDRPTLDEMRTLRGQAGMRMWDDYGLGLAVQDFSCGPAYGHSGRSVGFTVDAWTLEGGDRSAVVLVNDFDADTVSRSILATALCE